MLLWAVEVLFAGGCGTTRMTDTPRSATEMLLVSQAVDNAVAQIDFSPLAGKTVYLDCSALPEKDVVDRGYLISLVRQQLVAAGALLQDEKTRSEFVVEVRSGGIGTDRHSMLIGTPAVQLPALMPGLPTNLPEIALIKRNDQRGVAKLAVFAYSRITGRAVWQSGTVEAMSIAKDVWIFGTGPFSRGSIRKRTELAGEPLPDIPVDLFGNNSPPSPTDNLHGERVFPNYAEPAPPPPLPAALIGVIGTAAAGTRPVAR